MRTDSGENPMYVGNVGMISGIFNISKDVRKHSGEKSMRVRNVGKLTTRGNLFLIPSKACESVHLGRPFKCQHCLQTFSYSSSPQGHKRKHSEHKLYECHQYWKAFQYWTSLQGHMTKHMEEKPHECQPCMKPFKCPTNLQIHVKMSSVDKHYQRREHEKAFRCHKNEQAHVRTYTGVKLNIRIVAKPLSPQKLVLNVNKHTGEKR